ncbi:sporulation protein YpjB [Cohnella suwonensis]|uniref:Sporulation protein YpjB n=1 Tax=Cohnella suwonensis TaxID=696072 RepID=A0ABW0LPF5_9BACL
MFAFGWFMQRRRRMLVAAPLALLFAALWLAQTAPVSAKPSIAVQSSYDRFLAGAESLYRAVNEGNWDLTRDKLNALEEQLRRLPMEGIATAEGIQALANSMTDMKRAVATVGPDERKWKEGAARLRLAADALAHPDRPIWVTYRKVFNDDINKLEAALPSKSAASGSSSASESAKTAFGQLSSHYSVVRTAASLQAEPSAIERADSAFRYASRLIGAESTQTELLRGIAIQLRDALDGLFPEEAPAAFVPPLGTVPPSWGWSATIGSFIVTVLSWVGWRRYKEDRFAEHSVSRGMDEGKEDAAKKWIDQWKTKK